MLKAIAYASENRLPLYFLSGRFGLIKSDALIPYYNKLLTKDLAESFVKEVVRQLRKDKISYIIFYARPKSTKGWISYYNLIEKACEQTNIKLKIKIHKKDLKLTRKT